jgi:Fur family ferric uptake transcriptional regulator
MRSAAAKSASELHSRGYRATAQRLIVRQVLESAKGHMTVQELTAAVEAKFGRIAPSSVYRVLDVLVDLGMVRRFDLAGSAHYEWSHHLGPHQHLVCANCQTVLHLDNQPLAKNVAAAIDAAGFDGRLAEVRITGICAECAGAREPREVH